MKARLFAAALLSLTALPVLADELEHVPPVSDAVVKKECGACHLAYPAKFLSAETWGKITGDLSHHFGEDAGLPEAKLKAVQSYYSGNAGRSQAGLLRISDQSWWLREHRSIGKAKLEAAKSKANCGACHSKAEQGIFEN